MLMVAMCAAIVASLVSVSSPANAGAFPGANGKIAFMRFPNGGTEQIFTMNSDGSNQTNISHTTTFEFVPDYSANGKKIAYVSNRDVDTEIFVMNPDGTNQRKITKNSANDLHPDWSPSGNKIAFTSDRVTANNPTGDSEIFIMNPDGTNPQNLTQDDIGEGEPAWSPDGKKIAFDDDGGGIAVMNAVPGAPQKDLTNNPAGGFEPTWQPLR